MNGSFIVSKFGGTSMGTLEAMERSALICLERESNVVVVSATSGTTDQLIRIAKHASLGENQNYEKEVFALKERHQAMMNEFQNNRDANQGLQNYFTELDLLIQNIFLLKELTPKAHDHILSLGERMSSLMFREILQQKAPQKKVIFLDARTVIKTDSHFGKAAPDINEIALQCATLGSENIYVTQGFIGSDSEGNTTILGRGGSDYSAALFAEGLKASVLEIWTDVAGIATTDPRLCAKARIIPELSYAEASEMAQYGAKILHPATIAPAVRQSIPVFVGSSFDQHKPGTWIRNQVQDRPAVRAITKRSHQSLLTITNPDMLNAYGFMGTVFDIFGEHRISVDCVTTSEIAIAVTVDHTTLENKDLMTHLNQIGSIQVETDFALISLIGNDLFSRESLAKAIFTSVESTSVRMMSLGASPYNFNFLIKENVAKDCIERLHQTFIEGQL